MLHQIENALNTLRKTKPLILNLTNYVTMDFMANTLLSLGAAPIMTICNDELVELIKISSAVNINIGTLNKPFIKRCEAAVEIAAEYLKPVILDPVGAGASLIRTNTAKALLKSVCIVRGNASEIIALEDHRSKTLGVESINTMEEAKQSALNIANKYNSTVVISGAVDCITDGKREFKSPYGSPLMQSVTGMGCTLTSVIAAFQGVLNDPYTSAIIATIYFGLCGQLAAKQSQHAGTFRAHFIDSIHSANFNQLEQFIKQSEKINAI